MYVSGSEESCGELGVEGGGWFISTALRCDAKEIAIVFVCCLSDLAYRYRAASAQNFLE
jgi:hypothetical protein